VTSNAVSQCIRSFTVLLISVCLTQGAWAQFNVSGPGFLPDENGTNLDDPKQVSSLAMRERIVYFDFDSFVIREEARPIIEAHGRRLRADPNLRVALEGHSDGRSVREYSLGLGQKRADAIRKALSLMRVADSQMEAVSFGAEKPAVPGHTEAAMQENRRVEINYR